MLQRHAAPRAGGPQATGGPTGRPAGSPRVNNHQVLPTHKQAAGEARERRPWLRKEADGRGGRAESSPLVGMRRIHVLRFGVRGVHRRGRHWFLKSWGKQASRGIKVRLKEVPPWPQTLVRSVGSTLLRGGRLGTCRAHSDWGDNRSIWGGAREATGDASVGLRSHGGHSQTP